MRHPYLEALRDGSLPNIRLAFQDFAFQYGLYSAEFARYLSAVIDNVSDPGHREILLTNLAEEQGDVHDMDLPPDVLASVEGEPHPELYRRFQVALGVDAASREATPTCPGRVWSQKFLKLCQMNAFVGVGAIGIGTEYIIARIYDQVLDAIKAHSDLTTSQRVFFDIHSQCDDEHAAQMMLVTEALARDADACEQIEFGIRSAIEYRTAFWDAMLLRARNFCASESAIPARPLTVGH